MSVKPVNGHLLIEPLKHESFVASDKDVFQEVGVVVDMANDVYTETQSQMKGWKVYFDSWLAGKFPKEDGTFFWLVRWSDVKAIEHNDV